MRKLAERRDLPGVALRDDRADRMESAVDNIRDRAEGAPRAVPQREQAARGPAPRAAHDVRPRAAGRDGLLPRHRELLAPSDRPRARPAAADAARLLPERLPDVHRREPRHRPADRRDVPRRPLAQADAGRVRLPAAVGARQPAAQLRGMGGARRARWSTSRRRRATTSCKQVGRPGRRAADPPDRPDRSRDRGAHGAAPRSTTCSTRSASASRRASACWSPP